MRFVREELRIESGRRLYVYHFQDPVAEALTRQRMFWSAVADAWREGGETVETWLKPVTDAMAEGLGQGPGLLLDLGCGASTMPLPQGWTTIGVDLVPAMLTPGRHFVGSFCPLAVRLGRFDAIASRFALMFAPDPKRAFAEAFRALKPGGRLVFAVWGAAENNLWSAIPTEIATSRLGLNMPRPDEPHAFRLANEDEVREMLTQVGFSACRSLRVEVPYFRSLTPAQAVEHVARFAGPFKTLLLRMTEGDRGATLADLGTRFEHADLAGLAILWVCEKLP